MTTIFSFFNKFVSLISFLSIWVASFSPLQTTQSPHRKSERYHLKPLNLLLRLVGSLNPMKRCLHLGPISNESSPLRIRRKILKPAPQHQLYARSSQQLMPQLSASPLKRPIPSRKEPDSSVDQSSFPLRILKIHNSPKILSRFEEHREYVKLKAAQNGVRKRDERCIADGDELLILIQSILIVISYDVCCSSRA
uniref:Uncharacterized protein n=1 Tax=Nelumbo nucifera TaxID=4432 RepID=A0A822ZL77_NELNU|nr:TPA_asm: hypothetical protein HUJ06_002531 [Nelumbo nucifera]